MNQVGVAHVITEATKILEQDEEMSDEKHEKAGNVIQHGVGALTAAAIGGLGRFATGPGSAAAIGAAGYVVKAVLEKVAGDMTDRHLSTREKFRVETAIRFARETIQRRLECDEQPRHDGFFEFDATERFVAEELLEGVVLRCKNEHEEKKLRFISNIFANAVFLEIAGADANAVLLMAERLSYRQICVLAGIGRVHEFPNAKWFNPNHLRVTGGIAKKDAILRDEVMHLYEPHRLLTGETLMDVHLSEVGHRCFQLMGLEQVPKDDVNEVVDPFVPLVE